MSYCNICGHTEFSDFSGRKLVRCLNCNSLERHRLVKYTLETLGLLDEMKCCGKKKALHLAPEVMSHKYLLGVYGSGYFTADLFPEKYPHAQALRLALPENFNIFPKNYFDLILHNHVLEHIPGSYMDHLDEFIRILNEGGYMVFTIPMINPSTDTVEGGELLQDDLARINTHGQSDHYKTFGKDFLDYFSKKTGSFTSFNINDQVRKSLNAPHDAVYVYKKGLNAMPKTCEFESIKGSEEISYWRKIYANEGNSFYNSWYKDMMLSISGKDAGFFSDKTIGDFGCGPRGSLEWLAKDVSTKCFGIDTLADIYDIEFSINKHAAKYVKSNETTIPLPDDYFDVMFTINSLDHADNIEAMSRELIRVTKNNMYIGGSINLNEPPTVAEPNCITLNSFNDYLGKYIDMERFFVAPKNKGEGGGYKHLFDHCKYGTKLPELGNEQGVLWFFGKVRKQGQ